MKNGSALIVPTRLPKYVSPAVIHSRASRRTAPPALGGASCAICRTGKTNCVSYASTASIFFYSNPVTSIQKLGFATHRRCVA